MRYVAITGVRFSITEAGRQALRESDSLDEPDGPVSIAPLTTVVRYPTVGVLYLNLLLVGDAWARHDFRAFERWSDHAMRPPII